MCCLSGQKDVKKRVYGEKTFIYQTLIGFCPIFSVYSSLSLTHTLSLSPHCHVYSLQRITICVYDSTSTVNLPADAHIYVTCGFYAVCHYYFSHWRQFLWDMSKNERKKGSINSVISIFFSKEKNSAMTWRFDHITYIHTTQLFHFVFCLRSSFFLLYILILCSVMRPRCLQQFLFFHVAHFFPAPSDAVIAVTERERVEEWGRKRKQRLHGNGIEYQMSFVYVHFHFLQIPTLLTRG